MLNVNPLKPEQQVLLNTCIAKINDIYTMLGLYEDSPDKFWTDYHLKSVMHWLTTVIGTSAIKGGINLAPKANEPEMNPIDAPQSNPVSIPDHEDENNG